MSGATLSESPEPTLNNGGNNGGYTMSLEQALKRFQAALLEVNDNCRENGQRERMRRAVFDQCELLAHRITSSVRA